MGHEVPSRFLYNTRRQVRRFRQGVAEVMNHRRATDTDTPLWERLAYSKTLFPKEIEYKIPTTKSLILAQDER